MNVGHFSLVAALFLSVYAFVAGIFGALKKQPHVTESARNGFIFAALLTFISLIALGYLFVVHDYRYAYVWQNSNNAMHPFYLVSAIWGGMDGSMLLWAAMVGGYGAIALLRTGKRSPGLIPWSTPIFAGSLSFFLLVIAALTNPFRLVPAHIPPLDGNGLNPLLQNPSMLIHPICLYAGFTGFIVPFAFCYSALLRGHLSGDWIALTRRWTLLGWGFLSAGIILGGNWAYIELGWGGFWAWDPVENASFLPWLTATAFLHSVMVQERRGMLKIWNVFLCGLTYILTVFGTFLTRSGIVQSVHAFAKSDVGWAFLVYIGVLAVFCFFVIAYRYQELRPENQLESYFSREAVFLFNNLILLGICFATFWGVMFPVISEAVSGEKSVVGPPFFNQVNTPLFLTLLFFMGVGPLVAWRKGDPKKWARAFGKPLAFGFLITVICLFLDVQRIYTAISFGLCSFVLGTIMIELYRSTKIRKDVAGVNSVVGVIRKKPRKYGGHLVHLGVVVMAFSITASMAYKVEKDFSVKIGERYSVGNYSLELTRLEEKNVGNYSALIGTVDVFDKKSGQYLSTLSPERRFYPTSRQTTTEVDIRITARDDLYIALSGLDPTAEGDSTASFKVFVNPLQVWLWFGSILLLLGTGLVLAARTALPQEQREVGIEAIGVSV